MTSSTILGMFRLSPFESLLTPSVCYFCINGCALDFQERQGGAAASSE